MSFTTAISVAKRSRLLEGKQQTEPSSEAKVRAPREILYLYTYICVHLYICVCVFVIFLITEYSLSLSYEDLRTPMESSLILLTI